MDKNKSAYMSLQLIPRIKIWLNNRGISDEILEEFQIGWNGNQIVIPIHDEFGNKLFNKYRRDPESTEGPKYRYEKGSSSVLYGLKGIEEMRVVIICEGELDALRLRQEHLFAVSSTGGAMTFKKEWAHYFEGKDVFVCMDTDETGILGAFNIQSILPHAKIISLPTGIKDVTDFFKAGLTFADFIRLTNEARTYELPEDFVNNNYTKQELKELMTRYSDMINKYMAEARDLRSNNRTDKYVMQIVVLANEKLGRVKKALKFFDSKKPVDLTDRIARAKQVPINFFVNFGRNKFANCVFHDEDTASMYYYEDENKVKCFGCQKYGDVIDVVQAIKGVKFSEAIKIILNE